MADGQIGAGRGDSGSQALDRGVPPQKILRRAAQLVARGWCQGAVARGKGGREVLVTAPSARKWCLAGAIMRAVHELSIQHGKRCGASCLCWSRQWGAFFGESAPGLGWAVDWNDAKERTGNQVVARLRQAAKNCPEGQN